MMSLHWICLRLGKLVIIRKFYINSQAGLHALRSSCNVSERENVNGQCWSLTLLRPLLDKLIACVKNAKAVYAFELHCLQCLI